MEISVYKKIIAILSVFYVLAIALFGVTAVSVKRQNNVKTAVASIVEPKKEINIIREPEHEKLYAESFFMEAVSIEEGEEQDEEEDDNDINISSDASLYVMVNYQANVITVYRRDSEGNYNPIKAITCSTGRATPRSGVYPLKSKRVWWPLMGGVWGHYTSHITGNILFHSVPYLSADPSSLEYWEYDKLGTACSAGCVRLTTADAKWIFENVPSGTPIEFYASSNPGPLGKPGTMKISWNEDCRGWDPTDPDPDNPWRNQMPEEVVEPEPEPEPEKPVQTNTPAPSNNSNTNHNSNKTNEVNNNNSNTNNNTSNNSNTTNQNTNNQGQNNNNTNTNTNINTDTTNTTNTTTEPNQQGENEIQTPDSQNNEENGSEETNSKNEEN